MAAFQRKASIFSSQLFQNMHVLISGNTILLTKLEIFITVIIEITLVLPPTNKTEINLSVFLSFLLACKKLLRHFNMCVIDHLNGLFDFVAMKIRLLMKCLTIFITLLEDKTNRGMTSSQYILKTFYLFLYKVQEGATQMCYCST